MPSLCWRTPCLWDREISELQVLGCRGQRRAIKRSDPCDESTASCRCWGSFGAFPQLRKEGKIGAFNEAIDGSFSGIWTHPNPSILWGFGVIYIYIRSENMVTVPVYNMLSYSHVGNLLDENWWRIIEDDKNRLKKGSDANKLVSCKFSRQAAARTNSLCNVARPPRKEFKVNRFCWRPIAPLHI